MNIDYKLIGSRIKNRRKECGFTQEKLSEVIEVTPGYISQIERGTTKISLDTLAKIANHLDCDVASFISDSNNGSSDYLLDDLSEKCRKLSADEKQMFSAFIDVYLQKNTHIL